MKLHVDWDTCVGHGKCYLSAPQLFAPDESDDWGKATVLVPDIDPDDAPLVAAARAAVQLCPEYAITLDGVSGR